MSLPIAIIVLIAPVAAASALGMFPRAFAVRTIIAFCIGIVLLGVLPWPLIAPADKLMPITFYVGSVNAAEIVLFAAMSFVNGLIAYFLTWPYGREIGFLAPAAGLGFWSLRSGQLGALIQYDPSVASRQAIYSAMRFEGLIWLAVAAAGFAAVLIAHKIKPPKQLDSTRSNNNPDKKHSETNYLYYLASIICSAIIAVFLLKIFAQDVSWSDKQLRSVSGQPANAQIMFAVLMSFGLAAFITKYLLNTDYTATAVSTVIVTIYGTISCGSESVQKYLFSTWAAMFFSSPLGAIVPLQMVAFGILGAVAGYWSALQYQHWKKQH